MPAALRRWLVELAGAFFLTFAVVGAAAQDLVLGAVAVAAMVAVVVHVGAHANPAVTLASVAARRTPASDLLPCWAAQLVGALVAGAVARLVVTAPAVGPLQDTGVLDLLGLQVVFAFLLAFVVLHQPRGDVALPSTPTAHPAVPAGLAVLAAAALLDPVAGSAFNPAAAFGQVVAGVSGWATIWPYLVGCPVGGALAGVAALLAESRPRESGSGQPSSRPG